MKRRAAAICGVRIIAWLGAKPSRARGDRGGALIEFAFVLPFFLLILFSFIWFAITLNNYIVLSSATGIASETLSTFQDVTNTNPCQTVGQAVYNAGPGLVPSNLYFTINVATTIASAGPPATYTYTPVITNAQGGSGLPSCSGNATAQTAGYPIQLIVTYPCSLNHFGFTFNCTLKAQSQWTSQ